MSNSIVSEAAKAFTRGHFDEALSLYRQAASLLGRQNFKINIAIAEKRLKRRNLLKNYSDAEL